MIRANVGREEADGGDIVIRGPFMQYAVSVPHQHRYLRDMRGGLSSENLFEIERFTDQPDYIQISYQ